MAWAKIVVQPSQQFASFRKKVISRENLSKFLVELKASQKFYECQLMVQNKEPTIIALNEKSTPFEVDERRFISLSKYLRVTAWSLRFLLNINKKQQKLSGSLSTEEIAKS